MLVEIRLETGDRFVQRLIASAGGGLWVKARPAEFPQCLAGSVKVAPAIVA